MLKLTLTEFSKMRYRALSDLAGWWVQVVDAKNNSPLWEIRRGSLFIFKNEHMPRMCYYIFKKMSLTNKLSFLHESIVSVLVVEGEDTFLIRVSRNA